MLEMAHIPYYFDPAEGGYRISRHFFLPPINLTITEALAILMLAGRMRTTGKLPLLSHGARAAVKVESALPKAIREHVGSMIDRLSMSLGPVSRHEGMNCAFENLAGAIVDRRVCRMLYLSFHEGREIATTVHPLRLAFVQRAWYLIAYSSMHREVRTFKLVRMRKITVTKRKFRRPENIDLDSYFGDAWNMIPEGKLYDVHLRFSPKVAGNVAEVQWHHSQRVEWNKDGSAEFFVRVDGLGEITWWALGYGDQVEVVSPPAMRRRIAQVAGRLAKMYRKGACD